MKLLNNSVRLTGNLGKNVEMMTFKNGGKKASMSIATSDYYKNKEGEFVTSTYWHNLIAYGKTADLMDKLLMKGSLISIEGSLTNRSYEHLGVKKYVTEVVVREFLKLRSGKNTEEVPLPEKDPFI